MKKVILCLVVLGLASTGVACSDDDEGGGAATCDRLAELCGDEGTECDASNVPNSVADCVADADTCEAAFGCLVEG